ncbi:hypothetical protein B296_00001954 [Ensete ventricosum]|uniref:Uncharacterized protein n=1 Tax=Ensete ventricosum TaxID=4639 RepID=A0A427A3D6_ENSVE|nr:hypothetical protein B296_00001954 [Ensete ventricosum]
MPRSCVPGQLACQRGRPDTRKLACHRHGGVSDHTVDLTQVRWARSTSLSCWRVPHRKDHGRHGEVHRYAGLRDSPTARHVPLTCGYRPLTTWTPPPSTCLLIYLSSPSRPTRSSVDSSLLLPPPLPACSRPMPSDRDIEARSHDGVNGGVATARVNSITSSASCFPLTLQVLLLCHSSFLTCTRSDVIR